MPKAQAAMHRTVKVVTAGDGLVGDMVHDGSLIFGVDADAALIIRWLFFDLWRIFRMTI
jgi:hypothetical protein